MTDVDAPGSNSVRTSDSPILIRSHHRASASEGCLVEASPRLLTGEYAIDSGAFGPLLHGAAVSFLLTFGEVV